MRGNTARESIARDPDVGVGNCKTARIGNLTAHTSPRRLRDTRQDGKQAEDRKEPHGDVPEMLADLGTSDQTIPYRPNRLRTKLIACPAITRIGLRCTAYSSSTYPGRSQ